MLVTIKKTATIDVNLVRKSPADLEDVKLSCETPSPKAPPSDLCNKITITSDFQTTVRFFLQNFISRYKRIIKKYKLKPHIFYNKLVGCLQKPSLAREKNRFL